MSRWYLKRGDSEIGPGTDEQLKAAFKKGSLTLNSLVKKEGQSEWVALRDSGILSPDDTNPFLVGTDRSDPGISSQRAPGPSAGDVKPLIRVSMFQEKPRYGRRAAPVYATFVDRFTAIVIDAILLYIVWYIFARLFGSMIYPKRGYYSLYDGWFSPGQLLQLAISGAYFIFLQHEWGYTIGRKVMGIHVEMLDRQRPDLRVFIVRYVSSIVSGLILAIGYFLALGSPKMQTFHDRLANTIVVKD